MRILLNAKTQSSKDAKNNRTFMPPVSFRGLRPGVLALISSILVAACSLQGGLEPLPTLMPMPPTVAASSTPLATATATLAPTPAPPAASPTEAPRAVPAVADGTPATVGDLADPALPSEDAQSLDHFLFVGRPVPPHASVIPAASYRYGSTYEGRYDTHHGVEFENPAGTQLIAVAPATVFWAGDDSATVFGTFPNFYGNLVVLRLDEHWQGHTVYALYGHMLAVSAEAGQTVTTGDLLGYIGSSGIARGPHLHLEARLDNPTDYNSTRNPELWLAPLPGTGIIAGRVIDSRGKPIPDARVDIKCADGRFRFADTYHDDTVTPDDNYHENFALGDVPAGLCQLSVDYISGTVKRLVTVNGAATTFIVLQP